MTPLAKFVLFSFIGSAACYAVTAKVPRDTYHSKSLPVAGWEELDACLPMQSLDGKQALGFSENHTVQLSGPNVPGRKTEGVWAFDESDKRYLMTLGSEQKSYVLVRPKTRRCAFSHAAS
jgi:hypothetical protein